jgi:hypothetical protein
MRRAGGGLTPPLDFCEPSNRRQIFRRPALNAPELALGFVQPAESDERPAEGGTGRQIPRVVRQPRTADVDGFLQLAAAAKGFRELAEDERRRLPLNAPAKVLDSRALFLFPGLLGHAAYGTVTFCEITPLRPRLSVTVNVTVYVPGAGYRLVTVAALPDADFPSPNAHA